MGPLEQNTTEQPEQTVTAGALAPWQVGELPPPPSTRGWRLWAAMLGPGLVMAGVAIGSGEWLFGPAVTAQYGAGLLWLASISIMMQVFCNLMFTRYAIYCGEPIIVGGLRTRPGPKLWAPVYFLLDVAMFFPYNAANAAVALTALCIGTLPGDADMGLVRTLGFVVFLVSFIPLVFGGTIYRTVERLMTFKVFFVLGFLTLVAVLMVSGTVWWETLTGFLRFGAIPVRADTVLVGERFLLNENEGDAVYSLQGTMGSRENPQPVGSVFSVIRGGRKKTYSKDEQAPAEVARIRKQLFERAALLDRERWLNRFSIETRDGDTTLTVVGRIEDRRWHAEHFTVAGPDGKKEYIDLPGVPEPYRTRFTDLVRNQGVTHVGLVAYTREHGRIPPLDLATLAAFAAIAGIGGLGNTLFSNYVRDKGWGMGAHVGAIPSMIGGRNITLSHTGRVFPLDEGNTSRWRSWMRHLRRDQVVFIVANFIGMALPCMLSLEFIRHATVKDHQVAAMAADGMAARFPSFHLLFWVLTLFCGFIILAPGQVVVCDMIARRWTDIAWSSTKWARGLSGRGVTRVYYSILALYAIAGLIALSLLTPLQTAKIAAVLMNVALGVSSLHALFVNRSLMPRELQPSWLLQVGTVLCGLFFLGVSAIVLWSFLPGGG